jgi:hypothetical protein
MRLVMHSDAAALQQCGTRSAVMTRFEGVDCEDATERLHLRSDTSSSNLRMGLTSSCRLDSTRICGDEISPISVQHFGLPPRLITRAPGSPRCGELPPHTL